MYEKVTCRIRDKVEVSKHYSGRYGAPGMAREEKKKPTPEEMAKQNHWRRCRDLRRLLELNFEKGDWHVTLTCEKDKRPAKEDAKKVIRDFLGKLRREYKKRGWDLKWVVTCETGERGAVHWHMIVNAVSDGVTDTHKLIQNMWQRGRPYFSPLDNPDDFSKLADYLVKEAAKKIDKGETDERMSYSRSRNLIKPKERREKVRATGWRKEPKIPEGWELVPGSLLNGTNKYTGLPYQRYVIRRKEGAGSGKSEPVHRDRSQRAAPKGRQVHLPHGVPDEQGDADKGRQGDDRAGDGESADGDGTR